MVLNVIITFYLIKIDICHPKRAVRSKGSWFSNLHNPIISNYLSKCVSDETVPISFSSPTGQKSGKVIFKGTNIT